MVTDSSRESRKVSSWNLFRFARVAGPMIVLVTAIGTIMGWGVWTTMEQLRLEQELFRLQGKLTDLELDIQSRVSYGVGENLDLDSIDTAEIRRKMDQLRDRTAATMARVQVLERTQSSHDTAHKQITSSLGGLYERTNVLLYGRGAQDNRSGTSRN